MKKLIIIIIVFWASRILAGFFPFGLTLGGSPVIKEASATTYWNTARTAYWDIARTDYWNETRDTEAEIK